jgi:hypothetical protein
VNHQQRPTTSTAEEETLRLFDDLTQSEDNERLRSLEEVIERGLPAFVEVGKALLEIKNHKLYQPQYRTFEQYCAEKWRIDQSYAYRLMDSAQTIENLKISPIGELLPANEAQTRPLVRLPADKQRQAWSAAVKSTPTGKMPTARHVQAVVNRMRAEDRQIKRSEGWTAEELAKDNELKLAFQFIASAFGEAVAQAIQNGTIGLKRGDIIFWAKLPTPKALEIQDLVMGNRWTPADAIKFAGTMPDDNTTVEDLKNYCLATKDKFYTATIGGFTITVKGSRAALRK